AESLLVHDLVHEVEAELHGHHLPQEHAAHRGGFPLGTNTAIDLGLQIHSPVVVGRPHFIGAGEDHAGALGPSALTGHVVAAQNDVLAGHDDGSATGGAEDVVGG